MLKAGGAYVPLDPEYPAERRSFMLRRRSERAIVLDDGSRGPPRRATRADDAAPPRRPVEPRPSRLRDLHVGLDRPAEGRVNTHRGIVNRLLWMQDAYRPDAGRRGAAEDAVQLRRVGVGVLLAAADGRAAGAWRGPAGTATARYLADLIAAHGITTLHFVPSMLQAFLDDADACAGARRCGA